MSETILAWHFLSKSGLMRNGKKPPADGEWLVHDGLIVPCESGLHASVHPMDALKYAPGPTLCRVECRGEIVYHGKPADKLACRERRILWRRDITPELRAFARQCASDVLHLWDAPQVVKDYLATGDEALRAAAGAAAGEAAGAAARAAAMESAWEAAREAAWEAAWSAAMESAREAAREAARAAQRQRFADLCDLLAELAKERT